MRVLVNGAPADVDDRATVAAVVAARATGEGRVAVAVNGEVVPRSAWSATTLRPGDSVELLAAVAGG